ncbi:MAG: hypothetical protein IPH13_05560 [Planctomycetes bacterium]|nr:hypothetical protein [Planctomycetota bacterium]MCC7172446.1 hypothetical protein [Planctomycetota bacterium]
MNRPLIRSLFATLMALVLADAARCELVATQKGSKLKIKGAPESDSIQLDGTGSIGRVLVSQAGVNPQAFLGVFDIEISTGTGNDQVFVNGIEIGGSLVVNTGDGVDQVDIDNTRLDGLAFPVMIGKNVTLRLGGYVGEQVDVDTEDEAGFLIGGNTTIEGASDIDLNGDGTDPNYVVGDILLCGDLRIKVDEALDQNGDAHSIDLDNVVVGGATRLKLSNRNDATGNDFVRIKRSSFVRNFEANLRAGNDELHFDALPSKFGADFVVCGGAGENVVLGAQSITVAGATKFTDVEQ